MREMDASLGLTVAGVAHWGSLETLGLESGQVKGGVFMYFFLPLDACFPCLLKGASHRPAAM